MIFVNKMDIMGADFYNVMNMVLERFKCNALPIQLPIGSEDTFEGIVDLINNKEIVYIDPDKNKGSVFEEREIRAELADKAAEYRTNLIEHIVEQDEELMEKFFEGEELTKEEITRGLTAGVESGEIYPVYACSGFKVEAVDLILDALVSSAMSPADSKGEKVTRKGEETVLKFDENGPLAAVCFKTVADPFVGKMSFFKVMNGTLNKDTALKNITTGKDEKFAHIMTIRGKKQTEVDVLNCGDIGVVTKLTATNTNDTLTTGEEFEYRKIVFPRPYMEKAIVPAAKGDEDKISTGIQKILEEDPTIRYENNAETKQMTIFGMGDMHLDILISRMKNRYGTAILLEEPRIAYRETIKGRSDVEGKHKKQSGGSGQYGHVKMRFSHGEEEGLTFTQSVVGGTVPKGYYPAVEKGLLEAMTKGVLAGYPVVNLAADLYDGSYHPVDSNEISFKLAAKLAYKEGLPKANPVILEPIGTLKVCVPGDLVGDVMGDLNKRRGRVLGMNPYEKKSGYQIVEADVPKAEMSDYTIVLRAMTQGRGRYDFDVDRYEEVPGNIAQKIIAESKNNEE